MIDLLIPLGFLGFLGIGVLIAIYLIRPNYQTKYVSSTYVWKLSLRYKRKRIPTSPLRNILLFICQILILTAMTLIFTQPVWRYDYNNEQTDTIAIIDSSASMYAEVNGTTRFARAVQGAIDLTNTTAASGGNMSVIIADATPEYLNRRVPARSAGEIITNLRKMLEDGDCSYGAADIDGAVRLCEDVLTESTATRICIFTDLDYSSVTMPKNVEVIPVTPDSEEEEEWNVGILDARAEIVDGYYAIYVDVACYGGSDLPVTVDVQVETTDEGNPVHNFSKTVFCTSGDTKTAVFISGTTDAESEDVFYFDIADSEKFSSFKSIHISVNGDDSFPEDNSFNVFGGQKELVRVMYSSSDPNPFFSTALNILQSRIYGDKWDIRVSEEDLSSGGTPTTTGYDLYVYEHTMPAVLPRDGAVLLADPSSAPSGAGFSVMRNLSFNGQGLSLTAASDHPVIRGCDPDNVRIWETRELLLSDNVLEPLLYCNTTPVLLAANKEDTKLAVMTFSVNRSNIVRRPDFMLILANLFEYYFPSTVEKYSYEVGEPITVNARGPEVRVKGTDTVLKEFPATLNFSTPRVVTLEQDTYYTREYPDVGLYVKMPSSESNLFEKREEIPDPFALLETETSYDSLIIWVAAALVALLFAEWWLQSRGNR